LYRSLLVLVMGAAVAACDTGEDMGTDGGAGGTGGGGTGGTGGSGGTGGKTPDGGTSTDGASGGTAYKWIAIFDDDLMPVCTGSGPGADIDSVDLLRGADVIGVGLKTSPMFVASAPGGPTNTPCNTCGGATCKYSGMTAADRAGGIQDGKVNEVGDDIGYISLNAGLLWIQVGQANGNGPAQDIKSGDKIIVHEVDKTYIDDGSAFAGCGCAPEKYTVFAYQQMGQVAGRVQLKPVKYREKNTACGAVTPAASETKGCGTTDFTVP
jgi:hypothetical protein